MYRTLARYQRYDDVYRVSDLRQVRNTKTNKILHPIKLKNRRIYVTLSSDGFQEKCTVHNLVADAFLGECPAVHEIRHKDGDCTQNEFEPGVHHEARKSDAVRDGNRRIFGEPDETDTDHKRTAPLPSDRICE
jgi:hypothetical protein